MANLLISGAIVFSIVAFFSLFFNGGLAFISLVIAGVCIVYWNNTPEGKAYAAKLQAESEKAKQEAIREAQALEAKALYIGENPTDINALNTLIDTLNVLPKEKLQPVLGSVVLFLLKVKPLDNRVRATVLACGQRAITRTLNSQTPAKDFYDAALDILQQHPEQIPLKQYALEVGRWYYSLARSDGKVTIYDEQSIQNDILVRSK